MSSARSWSSVVARPSSPACVARRARAAASAGPALTMGRQGSGSGASELGAEFQVAQHVAEHVAVAGVEVAFGGRALGEDHRMAGQLDVEVVHRFDALGAGDAGAVHQLAGRDQHAVEAHHVFGRDQQVARRAARAEGAGGEADGHHLGAFAGIDEGGDVAAGADPFDGQGAAGGGDHRVADREVLDRDLAARGGDAGAAQEAGVGEVDVAVGIDRAADDGEIALRIGAAGEGDRADRDHRAVVDRPEGEGAAGQDDATGGVAHRDGADADRLHLQHVVVVGGVVDLVEAGQGDDIAAVTERRAGAVPFQGGRGGPAATVLEGDGRSAAGGDTRDGAGGEAAGDVEQGGRTLRTGEADLEVP